MSGIQNFEAFLVACVVLNLLPGSDTFYILGRSLAHGKAVGIASALGISAGILLHSIASAVGLSAIITSSDTLFMLIKMAGAVYLVYLGVHMLRQNNSETLSKASSSQASAKAAFKQGLITNVLNPKIAIFFLAFLPQFITSDNTSPMLSLSLLGLTFVCTSTIWTLILAWSSSVLGDLMKKNPLVITYMNRGAGALLVGLGIKLAIDS